MMDDFTKKRNVLALRTRKNGGCCRRKEGSEEKFGMLNDGTAGQIQGSSPGTIRRVQRTKV